MASQNDDFSTLLRVKIEGWLKDENWKVERRADPETNWFLIATAERRRVFINQPLNHNDLIVCSTAWRLPEDTQAEIHALDTRTRRSLAYDIQHALLLLGVDFSGAGDPLKEMIFGLPTYLDGLSKDLFMARVSTVAHAPMLAQGLVSKVLNRHPA